MNIKQIWSIVPNLPCTADVISHYPFLFCRNTSFRRYYTAIAAAAAFKFLTGIFHQFYIPKTSSKYEIITHLTFNLNSCSMVSVGGTLGTFWALVALWGTWGTWGTSYGHLRHYSEAYFDSNNMLMRHLGQLDRNTTVAGRKYCSYNWIYHTISVKSLIAITLSLVRQAIVLARNYCAVTCKIYPSKSTFHLK